MVRSERPRPARGSGGRRTNLAILALVVLALVSGAVAFGLGTAAVAWAVGVHAVAGFGLALLSGAKWRIVRRGLDRRPLTATWPSVALGLLVVVTVLSGVLRSAGLVLTYGPLDDMQVHVGAALLAVPLALWHVVGDHATRPARRDLSRRNLLRSGLLLGSAGAVWAATEQTVDALDLPGADRRRTGSYEQGSQDPDTMPATIWLFDRRPDRDPATWTVRVADAAGTQEVAVADLAGDRLTATLDCTSGWWATQDWTGRRLDHLVGDAGPTGSILVRSATGYARRFPLRDRSQLLLATGYAGRPLAPRHGGPVRLVAPGRRGFWWVKWVTEITVDGRPWWRQPPFPLQ